jgi:predicted permease
MRALGASHRAVLADVAVRALVLSAAGLVVGWWVARGLVASVIRLLPPDFPRADGLALDGVAPATAIAAAFVVALGAGVLSIPWKDTGLGADVRPVQSHRRVLGGILVAQTALAVVLLGAGGLLVRSFIGLSTTDPGIDPDASIAVELRLPSSVAESDEAVRQFVSRVDAAVAALPGVVAAGQVQRSPFAGGNWSSYILESGQPDPATLPEADVRVVTPGYMAAIGLPLLRGRPFGPGDTAESPRTVLVNELLADRMWPGEDPIGRRLVVDMFDAGEAEVVGVVGPVRHHGLATQPRPEVYVPWAQAPVAFSTLVIRGTLDAGLVSAVRRVVREVEPAVTVSRPTAITELVDRSIAIPRMHAFVFGGLAVLALVLSGVGIFSVALFNVTHGARETGLRAALGATSGQLCAEMLIDAGRRLGAGLALGLLAALLLIRGLSALLYGLTPFDPVTWAVVVLTLGAVGLGATFVPALRAARADPMVTLRETA